MKNHTHKVFCMFEQIRRINSQKGVWFSDFAHCCQIAIRWGWTVVLEKALESPLDSKEIKPVNPKGNQSWIFIGRTDAEVETPILRPPDPKSRLTGKDPDAGKDWGQEEKVATEDEMIGWYHWLYGHEFEQALGVDDGQGSLVCCRPRGHKESDMTERRNWTESVPVRSPPEFISKPALTYANTDKNPKWSVIHQSSKRETVQWPSAGEWRNKSVSSNNGIV